MSTSGSPADSVSLAARLRTAFAAVLVLLLVVGLAGVGALALVAQRVGQVTTTSTPAVEANARLLQVMVDAQAGLRGYQITGDTAFLRPYAEGSPQVDVHLRELVTLVDEPETAAVVAAQRRSSTAWLETFAEPDADPTSADVLAAQSLFDDFRAQNSEVTDRLRAARAEARGQIDTLQKVGIGLVTAMTLVCALVGGVTATRTVRALNLPLRRLGDVLERLRMGESSARAEPSGPVEFRAVTVAANALADETERLRDAAREQARLRRVAHDASRAVREKLEQGAVLEAAAEALGVALDVDRVWIRFVPPTQGTAMASEPRAADVQWSRLGLQHLRGLPAETREGLALTRRLWREGEVMHVPNVQSRVLLDDSEDVRRLAVATGATSLVVAPVGGNDEVLAAVTLVGSTGPREFAPAELGAVQSVCADLGRALEHSLLFSRQQELVDRLQELDRQKTDFLSTVSHELRTPLTSIAGYAELLRDGDAGPVTASMARMLEVIERNTARLKALIEDLLTLSRIESAAFRSSVEDVNVAALLRGVEQAVQPQAAAGGLELQVGEPPPGLHVRGDELQLERVLLNLVSNALKFTPGPGRVEVRVGTEDAVGGDWVVLSVTDTGIGIPADEQDQLFTRFFRASNAVVRAVPGTGLGLTIVRSIVDHHGGRLDLVSAPGRGTTVTVRLPLATVTGEQRATGEQPGGTRRFDVVGQSLAD